MPAPQPGGDYFNLEINCCGQLHLGSGGARQERRLVEPALASDVEIVRSLSGSTKEPGPADDRWWIAVRLPFRVLSEFMGKPVAPTPEQPWRANFYRCGGETDPQYASWSPIGTPKPDFHAPDDFGELVFGS